MSIRKKMIVLLVFAFVGINLYAQESGWTFKPFFGGGGGTAVFDGVGGYGFGGVGEFAFLFYDKGLQAGSHILGRGDSITTVTGSHYGGGAMLLKLSLGGFFPKDFLRGYSFVQGGVGIGGGNETVVQNFIFGGGGGLDLFFHKKGSFYFEAGYLQHYVNNELVGGVSICIGTRGYF